jgi:hypothetical protein
LGFLENTSPASSRGLPVPQSNSELLHALDAANTGSEIRAEQAAIDRFVGQSTHSAEAQVDGAGRQFPGFEVHAVVGIVNIELNEKMEFACPPTIPWSGAQRA